MESFGVFLTA
uniref:Uncharacterized protein n=1 Tax=Rhizophora mucronata TaxID=61149 RepID=A0A2P2INV5_RHIMU